MLLLAQWSPCGGPPAEAVAEVFLQLPEPRAVRVSGVRVTGTAQQAWAGAAGVTLAPQGDLATLNGIDVPSSVTFSVEVDFVSRGPQTPKAVMHSLQLLFFAKSRFNGPRRLALQVSPTTYSSTSRTVV